MADAVPGRLKVLQLAPFAKRAAQLERFKPIVTYWLRFYMVQRIIGAGLHSADSECTTYTTDLMEKLEQTKADMPNEDALLDDVAASAYCEQFALQTFAKGDKEMSESRTNGSTADTLLAASTFLELLTVWKKDEPEITSKAKYAKYHALRILKAIKAGEDPNLTNPVQETEPQPPSPPVLDPSDPEVQSIVQSQPPSAGPYQPYIESAPNTEQPSPALAPDVSPPPLLPSAPMGYTQASHNDVSPMSQPASSRQGSVTSMGGGYFPRTDAPPTFTSENTAPGLPTAPSVDSDSIAAALGGSSELAGSQLPPAPVAPDPSSFYQDVASPQNPFQSATPSAHSQQPQQPPVFQSQQPMNPQPGLHPQQPPNPSILQQPSPTPRHNPYSQPTVPPPASSSQGPFRNDEESIREAQKHAKWAISALNFDDSATAVKELRIALNALGAI